MYYSMREGSCNHARRSGTYAGAEVLSDRNLEIRFTKLIIYSISTNLWILIPLSSTHIVGCYVVGHYGLWSDCDILMFIFVTNYMYLCTADDYLAGYEFIRIAYY